MKKILKLILLFGIIGSFALFAQDKRFSIGGYGEILFNHYDYGPNRLASPKGSLSDSRQTVDLPRFILEFSYNFTKDIMFTTEIEFEHGGTGSALELEYEEFGEFEMEQEKGGEVVLEQFHITKSFSKMLNLRVGHFIVGVGQLNKKHLPIQYFTSSRPEGEQAVIPVTWHETGIEIFGHIKGFDYRLQMVNGLDANGFSSANWIKGGYQKKFELTQATNMAYVLRLEYKGLKGLNIGVSGYYGNTTENIQKPDIMKGIDGNVSIGSFHGEYNANNLIVRGHYLYGNLQNSAKISSINRKLSKNAQYPQTPVAKNAKNYAVEAGYNIAEMVGLRNEKLMPFARYEYYNSMEDMESGSTPDQRYKRNVKTFGVNYYPLPNLVIKADYSMRELGGGKYNDENTFGLSVGFAGRFLSL